MWVLGIESSCDETGVALVQVPAHAGLPHVVAQALHTQAAMHEAYGGVVPELASRDHIRRVLPLTDDVLRQAQRQREDIDVVADHARRTAAALQQEAPYATQILGDNFDGPIADLGF